MPGRGFLKTILAKKAAKELELEQQQNNNVPGASASVHPSEPILNGPTILRGRRGLLASIGQKPKYNENLSSRLSTLELKTPNNLNGQMHPVSPVGQNDEVSCAPTLHVPITEPQSMGNQQQPMTARTLIEEKAPVTYRVPDKSTTNKYHMTELLSNYIKIEIDEKKGIYMFNVDFDPPVDVNSDKLYLLNQHLDKCPAKTFDGSILYLPSRLPQNETILTSKLRDETEVTMKIQFIRKSALNECTHFYNVFIHTMMKILGLVQFGKYFIDQFKKIDLPLYKLEIWPGYITKIDEFENGLYMCCDYSFRILRTQTVLQEMLSLLNMSNQQNDDFKQVITAKFIGSIVITHYNRRTYRVDDIDFTMSPLSTFKQNGSDILFVDYYKQMYGIKIKDLNQPMLIIKAKKKDINNVHQDSDISCLVPELCSFTGLTESMEKDFVLMNAINKHTSICPEELQKAIVNIVHRINDHEKTSKKLREWGITLYPPLINLQGPVYAKETILLKNKRIALNSNMNWGMDVVRHGMFVSVNMTNWAILYNPRDSLTALSFCRQLSLCGSDLGMTINPPLNIKVANNSPECFVSTINNVVQHNPELQIIVILFMSQRNYCYDAVKRICGADIGIPSQIILSRTLSKPEKLRSVTQTIALQMNCKLGGAGWAIDIPLRKTMIVGIDVYFDSKHHAPNVVGFVASMNETFTQWYSIADIQNCTVKELCNTVTINFHKILDAYKKKNGYLPERIIIYRDGVSDSYLKYVEEIELCNLENYFKTYQNQYNPMLTFIIVCKRINTRLLQLIDGKYSNPAPGTVLDNTITKRNYIDFYLVSQNVRHGTVSPTHYTVLKNGCNLSVEKVQRLSYKLCHMYYNYPGTIKVPAPVQYAHKLAYFIGQNVRKTPNKKLANTLYYL